MTRNQLHCPKKILAVLLVATIATGLETGGVLLGLISLPIRRDSGKPYR